MPGGELAAALADLSTALGRRAESSPARADREAAQLLHGHLEEYLRPRALHLSAPLAVVLLGSTGSGKSSLFNAVAGRALSPSGVLRPTTRRPVLLAHPDDAAALDRGEVLPGLTRADRLEVVRDPAARRGLLVVDAPDFDSVETANRELSAELLEAADLLVFVTSATRYADQVPWTVLGRARERGIPMLTVLNRLPPDRADAESVLDDYLRLLADGGLADAGAFGALEVVPVAEGALDEPRDALDADAVRPVLEAFDRLVADEEARRELGRRALRAALAGLPQAVAPIAAAMEQELAEAATLRESAAEAFSARRRGLGDEIARGTFMRTEVLRQWQDFVGAGRVARLLAEGIGRIGATIRSILDPGPPPPAAEVREAAFADLVALTVEHIDRAAERTATAWSESRAGQRALASGPELWSASAELPARLTERLEGWARGIGQRIAEIGGERRGWARAASIGVNAMGTAMVLAVFTHTGGLTGAEVGITAATAVINQKLLEAIFGEAALQAFVMRAREGLTAVLDETFGEERARFDTALPVEDVDAPDRIREAAARAAAAAP